MQVTIASIIYNQIIQYRGMSHGPATKQISFLCKRVTG